MSRCPKRPSRLHNPGLSTCIHRLAHFRQLDIDDITQFFLGMVGYADRDGAIYFEPRPLVGTGVLDDIREFSHADLSK